MKILTKKLERRRNLQKVRQEVRREILAEKVLETIPTQPTETTDPSLANEQISETLSDQQPTLGEIPAPIRLQDVQPVDTPVIPQIIPPHIMLQQQDPASDGEVSQEREGLIKIRPHLRRFKNHAAGAFAVFVVLLAAAFLWQQTGAQGLHTDVKGVSDTQSGGNANVLAASNAEPSFLLNINIPSMFGKKVTFLDSLDVKKQLTVSGLSHLNGGITTNNANINAGKGKLTASNVIYSILPGSNITISGDKQNPTISANLTAGVNTLQGASGDVVLTGGAGITLNGLEIDNTGVTSLQGTTGDVTLTAGDGIDISGTTISNIDGGSAQNIFKNFTVDDGTTISADNNEDTINFAAGSGITLSGDAGSKTITITNQSSGALSGMTTNGVVYALSDSSATSTGEGPTGTVLHGNTGAPPSFSAVDLTADVTGVLPIANGGTGTATTPNNGEILIGNGSGYQLSTLSSGAGIGINNGAGSITIANTGVTSLTGTANQVNLTGSNADITISLPQDIATTSNPTFDTPNLSNLNVAGTIALGSGNTGTIATDVLTATRTYTFPDVSGEVCLSSGNCGSGGGGGTIVGSGATNFIAKFTSATGISSSSIFDNGKIGIGTQSPQGLFNVSGGVSGQALAQLNNTNEQNILVGSASGTTRFVFDPNGDLNIIGGSYQIGGTSVLSSSTLGAGIVNSSLTSVGTLNAGAITSGFGSIDVGTDNIAGGDITSVGTTGYTASGNGAGLTFSGGSTHTINATSGTLQIGAATLTGALDANGQNVTGANNFSAAGTVTFSGFVSNGGILYTNGSGVVSQVTAGTSTQVLHGGTTPSFGAVGLTTDVTGTLGAGNGGTGITATPTNGQLLIGNGSGYTLSTLTAGAGIGVTNGSGTITLANTGVTSLTGTLNQVNVSGSTGDITLSLPQNINSSANPTFASLSLTSNTNELTLGSGSTGTITLAGLSSARTYTLPDATGTICLTSGNCAGVGGGITGSGTAGQIAFFNGSGSITSETSGFAWDTTNKKLGIGNDTPAGKLDVSGAAKGKALTILNETGDQNILVGSASGTTRFVFDRAGDLNLSGGAYQINGSSVLSSSSLGAGVTGSSLTSVGALTSGSIGSGFGSINIGSNNLSAGGTITFGGLTTGIVKSNGLGVLSSSAVNLGSSDVTGTLAVGSGGTGATSIGSAGSVAYSNGSVYTFTGVGNTGQVLQSNGSGAPTWVDSSAVGTNYWQRSLGAVAPINITDDLLLGSTASTSAKFAFRNVAGGTPTASISANSGNNATFLTGGGNLATTNSQTLTIGGTSTGNIVLSPLNGSGIVTVNGNVNLASGNAYQINGANVLTATTLGSGVVNSSLTSVGTITGGVWNGTSIAVANGGTGATTASTARSNLGAAASGANSDITSLSGLTTALSVGQGGTGATSFTTNGILYGNNTSAIGVTAQGASGTVLHGNGASAPTFSAVSLTSDITGTLGTGHGGTGITSTPTNGQLLIGNGAGYTLSTLTAGTAIGITNGSGTITIANNGVTSLTGTANQVNVSASTGSVTLSLPQDINSGATPTFGSLSLTSNTNELTLGSGSTGTVTLAGLTSARTYTLPDATGTICLSTGNCAGTGGNGSITAVGDVTSGDAFTSTGTQGTQLYFYDPDGRGELTIADLTQARTYTLPDADGTICLTSGNCSGQGGSIAGSGTTGQLAYFTNSSSIGSDSNLFFDSTNKLFGIGNATPVGKLDVKGAVKGKALTILNETGDQNILTGSASGTTRFVFDRSGDLNIIGGSYQIGGTNVLSSTTLGGGVTGSSLTSVGALTGGSIGGSFGSINIGSNNLSAGGTITFGGLSDGIVRATSGVLSTGAVNLGNGDVTGTLVATKGGTGFGSYAVGDMLYADTTTSLAKRTIGSSGQVLTVSAGLPTWVDPSNLSNSYWQRALGALSPTNLTDDLLLGSTATNGAKFAFTNVAGGTPTASVSANSGNNSTYITGNGTVATTNKQSLTLGSASTGNIIVNGFTAGALQTNVSGVISTGTLPVANGGTGATTFSANGVLYGNTTGAIQATSAPTGGQVLLGNGSNVPTFTTISGGVTLSNAGAATIVLPTSGTSANTGSNSGLEFTTANGLSLLRGCSDGQILKWNVSDSEWECAVDQGSGGTAGIINVENNGTPVGSSVDTLNFGSQFSITASPSNVANIAIANNALDFAQFSNTMTLDAATSIALGGNNLTLGTNSGNGTVLVSPNAGGQAAFIVNKQGANDIFSASASGATKFTIANNGNIAATGIISGLTGFSSSGSIQFSNFSTNGGLLYTDGAGTVAQTTAGILGQCLTSNGGGAPSWGSCGGGAGSTNFFRLSNGALSPINDTTDLLIGNIATASAKFAFVNVNSGTPTASISANSGNNATYLTGAGILGTTNKKTLQLGDTPTGNVSLSPGGSAALTALANGNLVGAGTLTGLTGLTSSGTIQFTGLTASRALFTDGSSNLATSGTSAALAASLTDETGTGVAVFGTSPTITTSLVAGSSSFDLANTTATTLNLGGAATTLNIGAGSGTATIANGTINLSNGVLSTNGTQRLSNAGALSNITGYTQSSGSFSTTLTTTNQATFGSTTANSDSLALAPNTTGSNAFTGTITSTDLTAARTYTLPDATGTFCLTTGNCNGTTGYWQDNSNVLAPGNSATVTDRLVLGGNTSTVNQFEVNGKQTGKALVSFNETGDQAIFTASASGTTRFTITNAGDLVLGATTRLTQAGVGTFANSTVVGTDTFTANTITDSGGLTVTTSGNNNLALSAGSGTLNLNTAANGAVTTGTGLTTLGGNLTVNGATISLAGTNPTIGTTGNNNLTLTAAGTGNTLLSADFNSGVQIGTALSATPLAPLFINDGIGNNAALIVNNKNNGNLITASASGTTKFTVDTNGNITTGTWQGSTVGIGFGGTGVTSTPTNGQLLIGNGAGYTVSTLTQGSGITITNGSGSITVANAGVTSLTGTANQVTVSGATGAVTLSLPQNINTGASPTFAALNLTNATNELVLGSGNTGTITLGSLSSAQTYTLPDATGTICLQNSSSCGFALGTNYWQLNSGALAPFSTTADLLLGSTATSSAKFAFTGNAGTTTPIASISATNTGTGLVLRGDGIIQGLMNKTLTIGGTTTGDIQFKPGNSSSSLYLASNGNIGIGTTSPQYVLQVHGSAGDIDFDTNNSTPFLRLTRAGGNMIGADDPGGYLNFGAGGSNWVQLAFTGEFGVGGGANFWQGNAANTELAALDVRANNGTEAVASVSGATAKAALVVDQSGSGDIFTASKSGATKLVLKNSGDLYLAANQIFDTLTSGTLGIGTGNATTITLGRSGQGLTLPAFATNNNSVLATGTGGAVTAITTSTSGLCLISNNAGNTPSWATCPGGGAVANYWQLNNGAISPFSSAADVLIGSTATNSAAFAFINVAGGTPTASISASSGNNATYLTGSGFLGTTNRQTLTIGNSSTFNSTGNILINPNGTGFVGIGTNAPSSNAPPIMQLAGTAPDALNGTAFLISSNLSSSSFGQYGARFTPNVNPASSNNLTYVGFYGAPTSSTTTLSTDTLEGFQTNPFWNAGTGGSLASAIGGQIQETLAADGETLGKGIGLWVRGVLQSGCSTCAVTNNVGEEIDSLSLGTNNTELLIGTGTVPSGNYSLYNASTYDNYFDGTLGIGTNNPIASALDVRALDGTDSVASISGATTNASEIVDQSGRGDIFTASVSGATKFVITNAGNVGIGTANPSFSLSATGQVEATNFRASSGGLVNDSSQNNSRVLVNSTGTVIDRNIADSNAALTVQQINAASTGDILDLKNSASTVFDVSQAGFVGIGNTAPGNGTLVINQANAGGDIFTASKSGVAKFTIANNGDITTGTWKGSTIGVGFGGTGVTSTPTNGQLLIGNGAGYSVSTLTQGSGITITNGSGSITVANAGVTSLAGTTNQVTVSGATGAVTLSLPQNINTGASPTFASLNLTNSTNELVLGSGNTGTLTLASLTSARTYTLPDATGTVCLQSSASCGFALGTNYWQLTGSAISPATQTNTLSIGTTGSFATLDVRALSATAPVASVSGQTTKAALVVDNTGSGDLFTASKSGASKFTVLNNGNVQINNLSTGIAHVSSTGVLSSSQVDLLSDITNTLGVANGGTGATTFTSNGVLYGNTTGAIQATTAGTNGQFLVGVTGGAPSFVTMSGDATITNTGALTIANGAVTGAKIANNTINFSNISDTPTLDAATSIALGTAGSNLNLTLGTNVGNGTVVVSPNAGGQAALIVNKQGGNDIFTASASGTTRFTIKNSGIVVIGTSTNGITFDPTGASTLYAGTARPTRQIVLSPEYAGAVLTASGSAQTNGFMTSDASPSANFENYYEWTSTQTSGLQQYTIALKVTLPKDFSAWAVSNAITADIYTNLKNATTQNKVDILAYKVSDGSVVLYDQAQTSSTDKTWRTKTYTSSQVKSLNAGDQIEFLITLYSQNNMDAMVGDIGLNYLSAF